MLSCDIRIRNVNNTHNCEMASDKRRLLDRNSHNEDDSSVFPNRTDVDNLESRKKHQKKMQFSGNELIVAVFVTTFDMKKG